MKKKNKFIVVNADYGEPWLCQTSEEIKEALDDFLAGGAIESDLFIFRLSDAIPFKVREVELSL